jgi:hypothetical protein
MRRFARENGLSLVFGALLLVALVGQAVSGWADFNQHQVADGLAEISLLTYITSSTFAVDVSENWQSEFLQFFLFVLLTVWLLQKGSPESKELDKAGPGNDKEEMTGKHAHRDSPKLSRKGGPAGFFYAHSLSTVFGLLFAAAWVVQAVTGWAAYGEQRLAQLQAPSA